MLAFMYFPLNILTRLEINFYCSLLHELVEFIEGAHGATLSMFVEDLELKVQVAI